MVLVVAIGPYFVLKEGVGGKLLWEMLFSHLCSDGNLDKPVHPVCHHLLEKCPVDWQQLECQIVAS
jgi:hypothetical protein